MIIVLRSDFFTHAWQHHELMTAISNNQIPVFPIESKEQLRRVITEPAKCAGYLFDDTFVDKLIEEAKGEKRCQSLSLHYPIFGKDFEKGNIPNKRWENIGGIGGAISQKAEDIYSRLSEADKLIARKAFLNLVNLMRKRFK